MEHSSKSFKNQNQIIMDERHSVRILDIKQVTHDVRSYRVEKPEGYTFIPGQATEVCIDKPEWENERRPFTFTSLNEDDTLEFTIKSYEQHHGVTDALMHLNVGDSLILHDVWGAISYGGEGYFIAGGAGITPFIAILRDLKKQGKLGNNKLFFSNKTSKDVILESELKEILGDKAVFVLSDETAEGYVDGYINEKFLKDRVSDFSKHFYICGPDPMIMAITVILENLGANPEGVIFEK
ncbi:MAG: FAD-binding oxidoreductase [Chitinophagaceae bacterium]